MNTIRFANPDKILVRAPNWVGDAIMTTPALQIMRNTFPHCQITILAKPWVVPVFENSPHVDQLMVYEDQGRHKGKSGAIRLAKDLRGCGFDLAILFQNAFEAALIAWLAAIPRRMGFTTDARALLLTDRIGTWPALKKGHLVDYYIGLLSSAGLQPGERKLRLFFTDDERRGARRTLAKLGLEEKSPIMGINPGATYGTAKRWPKERFVETSRRLISEQQYRVIVFGGPGEARLGEEISAQVGPGCHNLCDKTSLREAMALIECCHAFITNDSGLMHVAAALDIPQAAIIGPTDPRATSPLSPASRIVQNRGSCQYAPCRHVDCPLDHRCMTGIYVDRVLKIVSEMAP